MSSSSGSMSDPAHPESEADPMPYDQTDFLLQSDEGLPIRGTVTAPRHARAVVVIVHGFKGFKEWGFFPWLAEQFAGRGIAAVRFDMSRNGIGERSDEFDRLDLFEDDTYSVQLSDLDRVLAHVLSLPALRELPLFLLGHSRGGAVVLLGAARTAVVRGVVTWSSIGTIDRWDDATRKDWRARGWIDATNSRTGQKMKVSTRLLDDSEAHREEFDIERAVAGIQRPVLIVHGMQDESVPAEEGRRIAAAGPTASLLLIGNAGHTYGAIHPLVSVPDELKLAFEISERFIRTYA